MRTTLVKKLFISICSKTFGGTALSLGQQQQRPCIGYITEQASVTTEMTLISQTEHGKEALGWRRVASKLAEEAARVGRLEGNQLIYQLSESISQFGNNEWVAKSPDCMGTKPLNSIMLSGKQTFEIMVHLQDRLIMFQVCFLNNSQVPICTLHAVIVPPVHTGH